MQQVDQLSYEIPHSKYAKNPWSYAPEFLKVFGDVRAQIGQQACFDCILLGSPRPRVCFFILIIDREYMFILWDNKNSCMHTCIYYKCMKYMHALINDIHACI